MRHVRVLALCALSLTGCPTTALKGTWTWAQVDYTLNTTQLCQRSPRLLQLADRAVQALAAAAVVEGYAPDMQTALKRIDSPSKPGICLIQKPEACRVGPFCTMGIAGPDCSPRAGCAGEGWVWLSVEWPAGQPRDWCPDVLHEVGHVVAQRLRAVDSAYHNTKWYAVEALASKSYSCAPRVEGE